MARSTSETGIVTTSSFQSMSCPPSVLSVKELYTSPCWSLASTLLHNPERKMSDPGTFDHPFSLQLYGRTSEMVEQPYTISEQYGHQVDGDFVEEFGPDALLRDACGAHGDALVARYGLRLCDGALDAICDECVRRTFVDPFLGDRVGDDESRHTQGRVTTPPVRDIESPTSRDERPHRSFYF